jgi:hypothetical protein
MGILFYEQYVYSYPGSGSFLVGLKLQPALRRRVAWLGNRLVASTRRELKLARNQETSAPRIVYSL